MKKRIMSLMLVVCLALSIMPASVFAEDAGEAQVEDSVLILNDTDEPVLWQDEEAVEDDEETGESQGEASLSTLSASDEESDAAALDSDLISYTSSSTVTMQIANEQRNGIYFLSSKTLKFYSLDDGSYSTVYTFSGCKSAYAEGDKLYVLYSTNCYVYDLNENELADTISLSDIYSEDSVSSFTAIGADPSGRIYVATSGTADSESIYQIYLCSADGTVLSSAALDVQIYSFSGFDSESGNFFMEGYYNWIYWGYNHPGRGVYMGNVTDDEVSFVNTSGSVTISGILTYTLGCLEYICQSSYYLHQKGADVIGGHYLVTASTTYGRVYVADTETLTLEMSLSRSAIEESQSSTYYDVNSIGVRTVYNEANDTIVIYENTKTLNEYDLDSGEIVGTYETAHYVFNLLTMGDYVIAIEKEDGQFYIELINWAAPTEFSIAADSETMKVGESQTLSVTCDADYQSSYTWLSSDSSVVSVTSAGKITAWKEGEAVITYTSPDGEYSASVTITVSGSTVSENSTLKYTADGVITNNISDNNYTYWSSVVNSYIFENSDGTITRLEYTNGSVLVETYSEGYELLTTRTLTAELSLFGGFYAGEDYNYLVFGQSNTDEDDTLTVLLVVKYTKSWSRVSSCSISAANTYIPFYAGSLRMTELDGQLYIYTCHEMYESSDGYNHQANMTFVIDEDSMAVTDSYYEIMNNSYGYVSHSFNQFIQTDGEYIFRVDHGDAYPRGVYLSRIDAGDSVTSVSYSTVFSFQGTTGANATGASVGGFELSDDNCLIAGNSVDQSSSSTYSASGQRNIFLTITDKEYLTSETVWLTDYTSSDGVTPRTPQLVKISDDQFLIMWEEYYSSTKTVITRMVTVNGDGEQTSEIISACVRLSDCQPTVTSDGYVVWYVTDGSECVFYQINPYDLETIQQESHSYEVVVTEPTCTEQGYTTYTCSGCGDSYVSDYTDATGHSYSGNVCTVCGTLKSSKISDAAITLSTASYTYNGSARKPSVTVKINGTTLTKDADYTVSYSNNTNAGTATVTIKGKGSYSGTTTAEFTIKAKSISSATVTLSSSSYAYDGSAKKPSVKSVVLSGTTLSSSDYTVKYASGRKSIGTYNVKVTGTGNYTGTATVTFTIKPAKVTISSAASSAAKKLTVKWSKVSGSVTGYQVRYKKSTSSSWTTVTVKASTLSKTLSSLTAGKKYNVQVRAYKTVSGTKYYGSWSSTKTVTVKKAQTLSVKSSSSKTVSYSKVKKAKQTVTAITKVSGAKGTVTYTKSSGKSYFTVNKSTGKITVKKGTPKGTYTVKIKVTSAATSTYASASKTVTVKIKVK